MERRNWLVDTPCTKLNMGKNPYGTNKRCVTCSQSINNLGIIIWGVYTILLLPMYWNHKYIWNMYFTPTLVHNVPYFCYNSPSSNWDPHLTLREGGCDKVPPILPNISPLDMLVYWVLELFFHFQWPQHLYLFPISWTLGMGVELIAPSLKTKELVSTMYCWA
jgi:hypothetical protein